MYRYLVCVSTGERNVFFTFTLDIVMANHVNDSKHLKLGHARCPVAAYPINALLVVPIRRVTFTLFSLSAAFMATLQNKYSKHPQLMHVRFILCKAPSLFGIHTSLFRSVGFCLLTTAVPCVLYGAADRKM